MDRWMDCREDEHSVVLRKLATSIWAIPFSDHAILSRHYHFINPKVRRKRHKKRRPFMLTLITLCHRTSSTGTRGLRLDSSPSHEKPRLYHIKHSEGRSPRASNSGTSQTSPAPGRTQLRQASFRFRTKAKKK